MPVVSFHFDSHYTVYGIENHWVNVWNPGCLFQDKSRVGVGWLLVDTLALFALVVSVLPSPCVQVKHVPNVQKAISNKRNAPNAGDLSVATPYLIHLWKESVVGPTIHALGNTHSQSCIEFKSARYYKDAITEELGISKLVSQHILKTMRNINDPILVKQGYPWVIITCYDSQVNKKLATVIFKQKSGISSFENPFIEIRLHNFEMAVKGMDVLIAFARANINAKRLTFDLQVLQCICM